MQKLIDGALQVWLKKRLLGPDVHPNRSYEKIIQILVCLYSAEVNPKTNKVDVIMPLDAFMAAVVKYIQNTGGHKPRETLVNIQRWTKNNPPLNPTQTSSETLLNSFVYAYLCHNPCFDPLMENRPEEKAKQQNAFFRDLKQYFNLFKLSRNPFTICWLVEILQLVSDKFNLRDDRLDKRMR